MSEIKLYNENCWDILRNMGNDSVSAVITDPPYDFDWEEKDNFHREFERIAPLSIVFCPPENQWKIFPVPDQFLFWVKPISTKNTSKSYSRFVEMIQVFGRHGWNTNRHWSQYTNVFTDLVEEKDHPYRKPLSMMERLVLNHTREGDWVIDPFMGSGTTGVACVKNNRNFIGIELETHNFNIAKRRINEVCREQEQVS